ncbi:MAG: hemerythrin domain-containing protein [Deltaproteobacteria bacterium]|nr:hemerythrin domain-containing protein [Deltaproteobacteria bacterium]
MKPRAPLMIEHRLIEKMLAVVEKEVLLMMDNKVADSIFIDAVVDFIRTYADRVHHGKEEEIMFRCLAAKTMNTEDQIQMQELIEEHKTARKIVGELVQAKEEYLQGQREALDTILDQLTFLIRFYPEHIRKEDKVFFPNSEKYLTQAEQETMLQEFWEFDRKMIHEKYQSVVKQWRIGSGLE